MCELSQIRIRIKIKVIMLEVILQTTLFREELLLHQIIQFNTLYQPEEALKAIQDIHQGLTVLLQDRLHHIVPDQEAPIHQGHLPAHLVLPPDLHQDLHQVLPEDAGDSISGLKAFNLVHSINRVQGKFYKNMRHEKDKYNNFSSILIV